MITFSAIANFVSRIEVLKSPEIKYLLETYCWGLTPEANCHQGSPDIPQCNVRRRELSRGMSVFGHWRR